jgi:hypothetical protein
VSPLGRISMWQSTAVPVADSLLEKSVLSPEVSIREGE